MYSGSLYTSSERLALPAAENYANEHSEYEIVAPPADRAIYILQTIMKKIEVRLRLCVRLPASERPLQPCDEGLM